MSLARAALACALLSGPALAEGDFRDGGSWSYDPSEMMSMLGVSLMTPGEGAGAYDNIAFNVTCGKYGNFVGLVAMRGAGVRMEEDAFIELLFPDLGADVGLGFWPPEDRPPAAGTVTSISLNSEQLDRKEIAKLLELLAKSDRVILSVRHGEREEILAPMTLSAAPAHGLIAQLQADPLCATKGVWTD